MGSITKHSEQDRKRARTAYYHRHGYEPSTSQLDTFLLTYVATDGFGSGVITGSTYDSGTYNNDCAPQSSDSGNSYSSSDSGSSYSSSDSGSSSSDGGSCGGGE